MLFAAFWVGGQVCMVLVLWAEWYGDREFPPSVRMLSPWQVAVAVFFCLGFWPGFIVMMALKRRELADEREADEELAEELAERYPDTHGLGRREYEPPPPMLCKLPCNLAGSRALCPFCAHVWGDTPSLPSVFDVDPPRRS